MPAETLKASLLAATERAFRPLARLLLASGIAYREFALLSKRVFVSVATDEFGVAGRPTNVSRVSLMTGLARKEVRRLRDEIARTTDATPSLTKTTDATRLLTLWHQQAGYLDDQGRPLTISIQGPPPSFEALHQRVGGDVPSTVMMKDLLRAGAVELTSDGGLKPVTRYFMPLPMDPDSLVRAGDVLFTLGNSLTLNITRRPGTPGRFEGRATNPSIPARDVEAFRQLLEKRGMQFLEEIDQWLSEHAVDPHEPDARPVRLGVGVYQILEIENQRSAPSTTSRSD